MAFLNDKRKAVKDAPKKVAMKTDVRSSKGQIDENKLHQWIKERAYFIWEEKGKPANQDQAIWKQAEKEIRSKVGR